VPARVGHARMRPFPVIGGKMWIMPWAAAATQEIMTLYFQDSRLPYADAALPPAAAAAMRGHRQRRNRELEAEAGDVVQNLALPYRFRWTPEEANAAVLVGFLGEIDLLVADVAASRLLVCEIKIPRPRSPRRPCTQQERHGRLAEDEQAVDMHCAAELRLSTHQARRRCPRRGLSWEARARARHAGAVAC
jgi:hypothetical protein